MKQILILMLCAFSSLALALEKKQNQDTVQAQVILERTVALIKPDAVQARVTGQIINLIELNKFTIVGMKKLELTTQQAQKFYSVHKSKPFYKELVSYMTSGPIIALALEKKNAIQEWRDLMGATNPEQARPGTIRAMFGITKTANAVHGSDATKTAREELEFLFPELE